MNIDDLKSNWNSFNFPPDCGELPDATDMMSRVKAGRVATLRDRLASISIRLAALCLIGVFVMIPYIVATPTLAVLAIALFVFLGAMHLRNYQLVRRLCFSRMSVREALTAVCAIETSRVRLRACGMALAFPLLIYMCFTFASLYGDEMLYGCFAGMVIGLILGQLINRRSMSIIREMRRQLSSL